MKNLVIHKFVIISLLSVNYTSLHAMQASNKNQKIEEMLCKARYIKFIHGYVNNPDNNENDCEEIPVSRITQYIQENEQGDNIFSRETLKTLAFTPESSLIEAYEIASRNMRKQYTSYKYNYHTFDSE